VDEAYVAQAIKNLNPPGKWELVVIGPEVKYRRDLPGFVTFMRTTFLSKFPD
jgi:hypothetical protein